MIIKIEHVKGVEVVEFISHKLELVVTRNGWNNLDEFISKANFEQREYVINYHSDTIHDMYRINKKSS